MEQMMIDTKAISMANNVTVRTPGHLSMHFNPAGLSKIPVGTWWNQGVTYPHAVRTNTFRGNPDFPGLLEMDRYDHRADPIYSGFDYGPGDEGWEEYSKEGLKASGTANSSIMYLPVINRTLNFAISPRTAVAHKSEGSRWTFATGMYSPYATGANHGSRDDPAQFGGKKAQLMHLIYQAPTVAYQVTDKLAVGVGMGAGQTSVNANMNLRAPSDLGAVQRMLGQSTDGMAIPPWTYLYYEDPLYGGGIHPWRKLGELTGSMRNDFTPSYNLGVLYEPFEWLGFGVVYQSEIKADLHGTFKLEYGEEFQRLVKYNNSGPWGVRRTSMILDLPRFPVPYQRGVVNTTMTFPQRIQGGVRVSPMSRLHLMFELKWAEWSVRDQDFTHMDQDIQLLQMAKLGGHKWGNRMLASDKFMRDTLGWGVAMEYNLSERLDVHMGYEYRPSANPTKYYDLTSMPDLHHFGIGGAYHYLGGSRIDFAFAYWTGSKKFGPEDSTNLTSTNFFEDQTNMFAGQYFEQNLDIYVFSIGFMVPFESYTGYQGGNRAKIGKRIAFLNPFRRSGDGE